MKPLERILHAMERDKGDNLERAQSAFRGMTPEQLDQQRGQSGKTNREWLEIYQKDRDEWQAAMDFLVKKVNFS